MEFLFYSHSLTQRLLKARRKFRAEYILSKVKCRPGMRILDVGCGISGRSFEDFLPEGYHVTGVDILDESAIRTKYKGFSYIRRNAKDLSNFSDRQFDLCVCIGMMEHICDREEFLQISREIQRVSRQYAICAPWKWCLIEPHFKMPFFQLYPYTMKVLAVKLLNLHGLGRAVRQDRLYIKKNYQWLSSREWVSVFQRARISVFPTLDVIVIIGNQAGRAGSGPASGSKCL